MNKDTTEYAGRQQNGQRGNRMNREATKTDWWPCYHRSKRTKSHVNPLWTDCTSFDLIRSKLRNFVTPLFFEQISQSKGLRGSRNSKLSNATIAEELKCRTPEISHAVFLPRQIQIFDRSFRHFGGKSLFVCSLSDWAHDNDVAGWSLNRLKQIWAFCDEGEWNGVDGTNLLAYQAWRRLCCVTAPDLWWPDNGDWYPDIALAKSFPMSFRLWKSSEGHQSYDMEKLKIVLTFCNSGAYCASNPSIKG